MKTVWGLLIMLLIAAWFSGGVGCSSSGGNGKGGGAGAGAGANGGGPSRDGSAGNGGTAPAAGGTAATGSGGAVGTGGVLGGGPAGAAGNAVSSGGVGTVIGAGGTIGAAGAGATGLGGAGQGGSGTAGHTPSTGGTGGTGAAGGRAGGAGGAPDVLILLDRSGSMTALIDGTSCSDDACAANSKWSLVKTALAGALPPYETTVRWGLKLFASLSTNSTCAVTAGAEIAPAFSTAGAITSRLDMVTASSSTPTTAAERAGADYMSTIADGAPKFLVLITDGIPTCGTATCAQLASGQSANQCDDANAIAAVQATHDDLGIPTMVVGIGTDLGTGETTLERMALAGGLPRAASPAYYPVQSAGDLTAALQVIATMATP